MKFNEYSYELASVFKLPDGSEVDNKTVKEKIQWMHQNFTGFSNYTATISQLQFNLADDEGTGFSEGTVLYDAALENGEEVHFSGAFKLFFIYDYDMWQINYFNWPGFSW